MQLTLLVSDAILPPDIGSRVEPPSVPGLETLLGRGKCIRRSGCTLEEWLINAWTLPDAAVAAVAPLTLLADGVAPGNDIWMRADPVHLHIERDHIRLFDAHAFAIDQAEADAFLATLNRHFAGDGIHFVAPSPKRWYCRVQADEIPVTTPLWSVVGRSVFEHMPVSIGRIEWKSIANEIQMLFFEHPVNQAREVHREVIVNGVWFWGAGRLPDKLAPPYESIFTGLPLARGLAMQSGINADALPGKLPAFQENEKNGAGKTLVVLHQLTHAVRANDFTAWSANIEVLDRCWFSPALDALKHGMIDELHLSLPEAGRTIECNLTRGDLYRFWRTRRAISSFAANHD